MPTTEMVRVVLVPEQADPDSGADHQIILDMAIDRQTGISTGPFPAFGRVGDFRKAETLHPFTLMFDGRMDRGAYAPDEHRHDRLEIRASKLVPGTQVSCVASNGPNRYVISTVTPLP